MIGSRTVETDTATILRLGRPEVEVPLQLPRVVFMIIIISSSSSSSPVISIIIIYIYIYREREREIEISLVHPNIEVPLQLPQTSTVYCLLNLKEQQIFDC